MSGEVKMIIDSTCMILRINKEIPPTGLTVWGGFESFALRTVSLITVYHKPPKIVKRNIKIILRNYSTATGMEGLILP